MKYGRLGIAISLLFLTVLVLPSCASMPEEPQVSADMEITAGPAPEGLAFATLAGGCFWCIQPPYDDFDGVVEVVVGYTGGELENPTYQDVLTGRTGHYEAVQITFDPEKVSFEQLLDVFWRQIDPTDAGGQFADRGQQYMTVIFYHDETQKEQAEKSKLELKQSGKFDKPIATLILPAKPFYPAEEYHQDYAEKNPAYYDGYKWGSGRGGFLEWTWQDEDTEYAGFRKPSEEELREMLTPLQYRVTQENATEPFFDNEYWDNKAEGIYVDLVSGEPLFSSTDKYESGTGWPSFTRPIDPIYLVELEDRSMLGAPRTEVRSKYADSHLGHVFEDSRAPETGIRYCINSAALRFVPKADMAAEGYEEYEYLFG